MYTEKELEQYGVAYYVFVTILRDVTQLSIPHTVIFKEQLYTFASDGKTVTVRDYFSTDILGELRSPDELLKLFKMRSNGN